MKNLITSAIMLMALLLPATAVAHDIEVDGIYYNINGNEASVTFRGQYTHSFSNEYKGDVTIPATVTCDGTTYTVTAIGESAFLFCRDLTNVTIPNTVTTIGKDAFFRCGVTDLIIPSSVDSIGERAFCVCFQLARLTVASGNATYDSRDNCNAIIETASNTLIAGCQNTVIPNSVTAIGGWAFYGCEGLTSVTIPNSVTSIGAYAFEDCYNLTSMTIPNSVTSIGGWAFYACTGLTSLTISNAITTIADYTFSNCSSLPSITIPNSVTSIGGWAFYGCDGLTSVTIPNSVTTIGRRAFSSCFGLVSVDLGNSVNSIGEGLFAGCKNLMDVTIPNTLTTISDQMFEGCSSLVGVTIPNSVTTIDAVAFLECISLTDVTIPNSVQTIGNGAFSRCQSLTAITIPNSVTSIGEAVFRQCINLEDISVEIGNAAYDSRDNCNAIIETASNTLIAACENTIIPNSVTAIARLAFADITSLTSITIPNSVTTIGEWGFYGCNGLQEVTMGNGLSYIGGHAFRDCYSLAAITIPNSVTFIGEWAFDECRSLQDVYSYITDPWSVTFEMYLFYRQNHDYSGRTLHVPQGSADAYRSDENWYPYFEQIVEMGTESDLLGDVNLDGEVNIVDINAAVAIILSGEYAPVADVNADGEVNIADINAIIYIIINPKYQFVDLGLPSGTLWARCNVGADRPEEFGDYFAWGETEPKKNNNWETYKWCNGDQYKLTKYCIDSDYGTVDGKTELELEDDAAYVNMGEQWRMPSLEQIQELFEYCSRQWKVMNDVNGILVTGPNGNTIFLPAAGASSNGTTFNTNEAAYYWSRTLCSKDKLMIDGARSSNAYILFFSWGRWQVWFDSRYYGSTIRAVRVPQP